MSTELLQFAAVIAGFGVAALLWLIIVFIPGRTVEHWKVRRPSRRAEDAEDPVDAELRRRRPDPREDFLQVPAPPGDNL